MKKTLTILLVAFIAAGTLFQADAAGRKEAKKTIVTPASDSRVTYIARTDVAADGSVSFDWSASMVRVAFTGDYLAVKASDNRKDYLNVWIDREPSADADKVIVIGSKDTTIVLAEGLAKGAHKVTLQKRSEGEQGTVTLQQFITAGELLQAEGLKARQIEFVGDSYTCGYGSENSVSGDPFKAETESSSKTYAAICGRYFDADIITVAHSGMGIARNYNDNVKGWYMPERYGQTFDMDRESKWDASKSDFKPAVTVIYLGTNDFSTSRQPSASMFRDNYTQLLKSIKANYGEEHPVLCVASKCDPVLLDYVEDVVSRCGLKNVKALGFFDGIHYDDDSELGASYHPNYQAHKKLAYSLIPYIATATGWGLSSAAVE